MKKIFLVVIVSITCLNYSFSQELQDGEKRWSTDKKLALNDFKIKTSDNNNQNVYSQFVISYSAKGFDFLKKNLNKNVENLFSGNASWIDTSNVKNIDKQIEFQQMQFDLAEIHARKFRQQLFLKKWKITRGFDILKKLSNKIMAEFSEQRMILIKETEGGINKEKLLEWKEKISKDLKELYEFRFENKKKIKRKK
ncbi:hypothetical protein [Polaribacter butkevichii]|uniref:Uncharacterized protein n=1 Tax=Polaribacter butkevichii TaxID=218490 RepID=A0A2P6CFP6_9FLAO|nr:hypothetical protein [Polaribacter butkevichii]PQJ73727.1 hypothetical protein BTO14_08135 [Polaribacter butkevichii]